MGGSAILKENRVITCHNSSYVAKLVEGDSDIMMQAYMKDVLTNFKYVINHTLTTFNFSTLSLWAQFAIRSRGNQLIWLQDKGFPFMQDAFYSVAREELKLDQYQQQRKYTPEQICELLQIKKNNK